MNTSGIAKTVDRRSSSTQLIFMVLTIAFLFVRCSESPKSDKAETAEAKKVDEKAKVDALDLSVDVANSQITWVGTKPVGKHNGTFNVKKGNLAVKEGNVVGGSFTIDIKTLKNADLTADKGKGKLEGHLLSKDFFDADKFPESKFEIVSVEAYKANGEDRKDLDKEYALANPTHTVTGNLELKGVTKSITFPAKIKVEGEAVSAEAKFNINRKDWGMSYGADKSLKDKFIRPTVHIGFNISAKKSAS